MHGLSVSSPQLETVRGGFETDAMTVHTVLDALLRLLALVHGVLTIVVLHCFFLS